jgi:hypothetical protein
MALLFMDSFDHYATADIAEKWTAVTGGTPAIGAYGRNSTSGLRLNSGVRPGVSATVLGDVSEAIVGVAVKPTVWTGAAMSAIITFGSGTQWECGLMLLADLTVRPFVVASAAWAGPGSDTTNAWAVLLGSASSVALQVGVWAYLEVRMKCDGSTGTCTVRLNGTEILALTGLDTLYTSATLSRVAVAAATTISAAAIDIDDLVVMDTTGSLNNVFLGDVTISAIYPSAVGNSTGWTPSAGSNYDCCNEAVVNDDTDYVAATTLATKDLYAFTDAPAGADIKAVQLCIAARKGAEGPGQLTPVVRSASTDYDKTAQGIGGTSYSYLRTVVETDPATAAAWTESGFNAAEWGFKKTG